MTSLHIQGMGLIGAFLAHTLDMHQVPFTWHDTDSSFTAWRASTGSILPTRDNMPHYDRWQAWRWYDFLKPYVEDGAYWFNTKQPPHGGKQAIAGDIGQLRLSAINSLHFNVQAFVSMTRQHFIHARRENCEKGKFCLITHGSHTANRYLWGWSAKAALTLSLDLMRTPHRACIYLRNGLVQMAYAYPVPGEDRWYIGTSMLNQRTPKSLAVKPKMERFEDFFQRVAGQHALIGHVSDIQEGWRPVAEDPTPTVAVTEHNAIIYAQGSSGVSHAPFIAEHILNVLRYTVP